MNYGPRPVGQPDSLYVLVVLARGQTDRAAAVVDASALIEPTRTQPIHGPNSTFFVARNRQIGPVGIRGRQRYATGTKVKIGIWILAVTVILVRRSEVTLGRHGQRVRMELDKTIAPV